MAWGDESGRTSPLPANWYSIRKQVLERDGHRCRWILPSGARCPRTATDVDHFKGADNHSLDALRSLCGHHHDKVTAQQGVKGRRRRKKKPPRRPTEQHPGLL